MSKTFREGNYVLFIRFVSILVMTISIGHNRQHQEQDTERGHTNKKEEWKHRNLIR